MSNQQQQLERRTATIDIYPGDTLDRIRHLEQRAAALEKAYNADRSGPRTLDEVPEYVTVAREHAAAVAKAEEEKLSIRVKALPRKTWKQLVAEHPPRDGHDEDKAAGVNEEELKEALVTTGSKTKNGVEYRTIISPAWFTDEHLDELSDIDFDRIYLTAFAMNRAPAGSPGKAFRVSPTTPASDATSS